MPACWRPANTASVPKSLSRGDQHAPFLVGAPQDLLVTRVRGPVCRTHHRMPGGLQLFARFAPYTRIQKQLHAA
jgi:hypothetical protein